LPANAMLDRAHDLRIVGADYRPHGSYIQCVHSNDSHSEVCMDRSERTKYKKCLYILIRLTIQSALRIYQTKLNECSSIANCLCYACVFLRGHGTRTNEPRSLRRSRGNRAFERFGGTSRSRLNFTTIETWQCDRP
jgi:hypothetical protein